MDCYFNETNGTDYRGQISTTVTGQSCLHWNKIPKSGVDYEYYNKYPWLVLRENLYYCRNPDGDIAPWCARLAIRSNERANHVSSMSDEVAASLPSEERMKATAVWASIRDLNPVDGLDQNST